MLVDSTDRPSAIRVLGPPAISKDFPRVTYENPKILMAANQTTEL